MIDNHPYLAHVEKFFEENDWPHFLSERLCELATALVVLDDTDTTLHYHFGKTSLESKRIALTACIMATISRSPRTTKAFYKSFRSFFRQELEISMNDVDFDSESNQDHDDDEISMTKENDKDRAIMSWISGLNALGWLRKGGLLREALEEAVHESILVHVRETISSDYESHFYDTLQTWQEKILRKWLRKILMEDDDLASVMTVACSFVKVRMGEIFDMVAEYPDSVVAIEELQRVLSITQMHGQVAEALRQTLIRRLNHPGANTLQIIDVYINTIKVLRILDPTDQLLTRVAEPVRQYLQGRQDTVRCIIASLTNAEQGGDLYQELKRQDAKPLEDVSLDSDDEGDCLPDYFGDRLWQPPPSIHQTHPSFLERGGGAGRGGSGKSSDILAMLVSIYGSKELFVNEYRLMLADKLLSSTTDYNTDQQVHTLELLKLRFGELSMRACEIMLKDINDSKRTNTNIRSFLPDNLVDAIMISHIFWPALQREPAALKHHPRLQYMLDTFGQEYARLKNPRKLEWLYPLGSVQLELDVHDGGQTVTKKFDCSPLLASLILHFTDRPQWTALELSNETGIPVHAIHKQMGFWVNHRVVKTVALPTRSSHDDENNQQKSRSTYVLAGCAGDDNTDSAVRPLSNGTDDMALHEGEDMAGGSGAVSFAAYKEEEMTVFTSYIVGMLSNLGQLPLKTIHNNLKTFVTGSDVKYSKTPQQLSAFLQHLCRQETLECGPDGMYKVLKKS